MIKKPRKGIAIIMALLIIAIAVSLASYMLDKQNLLIRKAQQQKISQNIFGLSLGSLAWAKVLIQTDINNIDYRQESWLWKINNLDISNFIYQDNAQQNSLYLSAYMEDAQAKFNINTLINWQTTSQRVPLNINNINLKAYENLLKILNINTNLANKTINYIFNSFNKNAPQGYNSINNFNSMPITFIFDLKNIGYSDEDINKLKNYVTIINDSTKININTCDPKLIYIYLPNIGNNISFFQKNPNLYANNSIDIIKFLNLNINDIEQVNLVEQTFDVKTKYIDIFANIQNNDYNRFFYTRMNKENQNILQFLEGGTAKFLAMQSNEL